ncbi:MAG TPA: DUF2232 domain-containing protein [Xanthobacteraceae bacterium]|jgi:hypothetical protein
MLHIMLIGLGAGASAALLFATVVSGSLFSILLFYLAPLPILIAALGWSHWAGLLAGFVAAAGLGLVFTPFLFVIFLAAVALPAWWLGYLALLARPTSTGADGLDWYPAGHLVLWAALLGGLVVAAAILYLATDEASFRAALRSGIERAFRANSPAEGMPSEIPGLGNPQRLIDFLVTVLPPAAAILAMLTNLLNLWIAGVIVRVSGRLRRPWPELAAMRFPPYAALLTALSAAGTFLPGILGTIAGVFTASLLIAFAALGLAVLHTITRGLRGRPVILGGTYLVLAFVQWLVLLIALLGLADSALDLRRLLAKPPPPAERH